MSTPLGFRSGRANVPVRQGAWYCEMIVERGGGDHSGALDGSHVRVGWGRREAKLNSPVGLDGYSYGIRDKTGEIVTLSRPAAYLGNGFGTGDVVGMYISLPERITPPAAAVADTNGKGKERETQMEIEVEEKKPDVHQELPPVASDLAPNGHVDEASSSTVPPEPTAAVEASVPPPPNPLAPLDITRDRIPINYKNQLYFETVDPPVSKEMDALLDEIIVAAAPAAVTTSETKKSSSARKPTKIKDKTLPSVDSMRAPKFEAPARPLPVLKQSKMAFFVNGKSPGIAFEDVYDYRPLKESKKKQRGKMAHVINHRMQPAEDGTVDDGMMGYYPFVSTYGGGRITFNPGPYFRYPPPDDIDAYLADPTGTHATTSMPAPAKRDPSEADTALDTGLSSRPDDSAADTDETEAAPQRTWAPLSSIYKSHCALQQALDERDEQFFIEDYAPDPDPIPIPPPEIAPAPLKRKMSSEPTPSLASPGASHSEPSPAPSSTAGGPQKKKAAASKTGPKKSHHKKKSRLGLHDGLVDSAAASASEVGGSSEASTPAAERPVSPPLLQPHAAGPSVTASTDPKPPTSTGFVLPRTPEAEYFPLPLPQQGHQPSSMSVLGMGGPFQRAPPSISHHHQQQQHPQSYQPHSQFASLQHPHHQQQQQQSHPQQQHQPHQQSHNGYYPDSSNHHPSSIPASSRDPLANSPVQQQQPPQQPSYAALASYPHSYRPQQPQPQHKQSYPNVQPYQHQISASSYPQAGPSSYSQGGPSSSSHPQVGPLQSPPQPHPQPQQGQPQPGPTVSMPQPIVGGWEPADAEAGGGDEDGLGSEDAEGEMEDEEEDGEGEMVVA